MILEDLGEPDLRVLICGMAAGNRSAATRAYYAGRGNTFWEIIHAIGLTPSRIDPEEWRTLLDHGIGLTDLAKRHHGADETIPRDALDRDRVRDLVSAWQPKALAFNGITAAKKFLHRREVVPGLQTDRIGTTTVWALPSTSGMARGHWDRRPWAAMAESLKPDPHLAATRG
jgi:TDG/mug DNA glycosylase family protein